MTLTIVGAGYVGLVTAAVFSQLGNKVFCVDVVPQKVKMLKKGQIPFYEPSLAEYIDRNIKNKRLFFTTSYRESVPNSQVVFICVGTPPKSDGEADLSYLFAAVEQTAKNLKGYTLIAIKSTIPIGFEDDLEDTVKKYAKVKFEFAANPEFLREGTAIEDTLHPDRIVIGTASKKGQKILLQLHAPISGQRIICDIRSAQLIKYASNSLLATKVSFANAIATLCEKTGADVEKVLEGVGADKRIGRSFLYPGVGYGGSCLPKDVLAFIATSRHFDYDFQLLKAVDDINEGQIESFINKVKKALGLKGDIGNLSQVKVAVLGLAFKPNTDDMRDAPSVKIINHLLDLGAQVTAYDPQAMENAKRILPKIEYAKDVYSAIKDKDVMVVVTEWPQFSQIDLARAKKLLRRPIIIDGRNMFDREKVKESGFSYFGIGR
ncbi:MAG: UDP-glucose dehydrogenase [Candidatus Curtissbacteria bacterium GW2011_GWA1_40_47]|uniref:UDP-glucose 6-dehydrogenase n=1 Tax=Candidatus Curtissbacteria bacterium RIFOXYA1_FULL_41_14 TaxID=1797737 RepID=A0A1F5HB32_9BACT|nr:MAG: UDP-glucose dehydrogenase [Candidatus Curtissbacteria bacterium GW2011_GWB1_40_28]KKR62291.1 MAG: nucleotide sugar dehydrogenase, UDPglucose 6-dehydrogenase [Microgenomates group bacterium GW2011_GWC1_40_35]KKR66293.1 MAG: UDP-glucose dehydrogenase [Candidatus Curtissbacteria bacterium GW2011_GWA1_40_47]KKR77243.1 MAG: UDP-glucose dehydrogenase [Candidatus Curtissbacteria bacterium GW2011_GWD1_40_8]KKS02459.1 MAG: UDP-glucose dehydrogenase [Candidatus Curtissbacteria bacterium GW2011_GW